MIITCESCATQFQLDSSRIPPEGIRVRCSICKHAFFVENHEVATGDPVDRAVGRALAEDQAGGPDVAHDLPRGSSASEASATTPGRGDDRFEQSFEAAREAVDDLLGFSSPQRAAPPPAAVDAGLAPAPEEALDEIVFDVEEELASEEPSAIPGPDPFALEPGLSGPVPAPDAWDTPVPLEGPATPEADLEGREPALDPWDTPLPFDGPGEPESAPDAAPLALDPWDTPMPPLDAVPATPAAASSEPPAADVTPRSWEEESWEIDVAGGDSDLESDSDLDPYADSGLDADSDLGSDSELGLDSDADPDSAQPAPARATAPARAATDAPTASDPEDELEEALALGWGGNTDTAGIELADEAARAGAAELDSEDDWDLPQAGQAAGEAAGSSPLAAGAGTRQASPAIGFGARLRVPRGRRIVAWFSRVGEGVGWTVVGGLAAVLLWATAAPRPATERPTGSRALAGLEASGIAGHWVENALAGPMLVVTGDLRNAGSAVRAPGARLVVRLLDAAGAPLDGTPTSVGLPLGSERLREAPAAELREARKAGARALARAELAPGESVRFEAVILSVPNAARRFDLGTQAPSDDPDGA